MHGRLGGVVDSLAGFLEGNCRSRIPDSCCLSAFRGKFLLKSAPLEEIGPFLSLRICSHRCKCHSRSGLPGLRPRRTPALRGEGVLRGLGIARQSRSILSLPRVEGGFCCAGGNAALGECVSLDSSCPTQLDRRTVFLFPALHTDLQT